MNKICLISLLKPADDIRMYQKLGNSLAQRFPKTEIHLLGFDAEKPEKAPQNIYFHPLFKFYRLSFKRFLASFKVLQWLVKNKPQITIICTFELLPILMLYKIFYKTKLVYDVQENYFRNILYTKVFPKFLRLPLAYAVRLIERMGHFFVSDYFLAEECYKEEMPLMQKKGIVLANKVKKENLTLSNAISKQSDFLKLSLVGTISKDYGVFEVLEWIEKLKEKIPNLELSITGFCPNPKDFEQLEKKLENRDFVKQNFAQKPISNQVILQTMQNSDILLLPYQVNQSVAKRIPTKMYEALALGLPMLIQNNQYWENFLTQNFPEASFQMIDFRNTNSPIDFLYNLQTYKIMQNIFWEEEEEKMWQAKCFS